MNVTSISTFFFNPIFLTGLLLRLALIFNLIPTAVTDWYVPFLEVSTSLFTIDPWTVWSSSGGSPEAFPYGIAMWMAFVPLIITAKLTGLTLFFAYYATLLIADLLLFFALKRILPSKQRLILLCYWLSPIVILSSYGLGLNDLIPTLFLLMSFIYIKEIRPVLSSTFLAAAISAKFSMLIAVPFFAIYFLRNQRLRHHYLKFLISFIVAVLLFEVPHISSNPGVQMLFTNPEMMQIYQLKISSVSGFSVYAVPLVYIIMLFITWRVRRLNFDLFQATAGLTLFSIVVLTPASPGWFVWSVPFLVYYQSLSRYLGVFLVGIFSSIYFLITFRSF